MTEIPAELAQMMMLAALSSGTQITGDEIKFHEDGSKDIVLPRNSTYEWAIDTLQRKMKEQETIVSFTRIYTYRPDDGAHAAAIVLKDLYGLTIGKATVTFFGSKPPELRTIAVGPNKTQQVPWGLIEIPSLPGAEIRLTETEHDQHGPVFAVMVKAARKHKAEIEKLFDAIDAKLKTGSIYRGHALVGARTLEFMDLSEFDATKIVFSSAVTETLNNALYGAIKNAKAMAADGIPIKRSILLYGPYGTGKSSVGQITGQIAERYGFTFLQARTGEDNVADVLRTARMYEPAVVFIEDIDNQASSSNPQDVAKLLETFDGITAKGSKVIMVMTTNKIDDIHAGMLRPGRLDYIVEIANLDREGCEGLIRAIVDPGKLASDVDFDKVYEYMTEFEPAFVKATADRAKTWALNRTGGKRTYKLTTADLAGAAQSLHPQLARLRNAQEGIPEPTLDVAFRSMVEDAATAAVADMPIFDNYDDRMFTIKAKADK
jgi:hypothetical protein